MLQNKNTESEHTARQYNYRVYYQIKTWLLKYLEPEKWKWIIHNEFLDSTTTILTPASEELHITIFCNCKKGCGRTLDVEKCTCNAPHFLAGVKDKYASMFYHIQWIFMKKVIMNLRFLRL